MMLMMMMLMMMLIFRVLKRPFSPCLRDAADDDDDDDDDDDAWVVGLRPLVCVLGSRSWLFGGFWEAVLKPLWARSGASWGLIGPLG
eukprot:7609259-Pyramimonas_sp.AAC.1